jgi:hypothetical protein
MNMLNPFSLVPALIALQFVVFGWRINREVSLDDQNRRTWLLLSDYLNLISMLAVVWLCVVVPLRTNTFQTISRIALGVGYVLICFTPVIMAGHYRLFSREGRTIYKAANRDVPWLTGQEAFLAGIAILAAAIAAYVINAA